MQEVWPVIKEHGHSYKAEKVEVVIIDIALGTWSQCMGNSSVGLGRTLYHATGFLFATKLPPSPAHTHPLVEKQNPESQVKPSYWLVTWKTKAEVLLL